MKKLLLFILFLSGLTSYSQKDSTQVMIEQIESSFKYQTGIIKLPSGGGTLNVPKGFRFLDSKQAQYIMSDLWGNPKDETLLGVLVPEKKGVMQDDSWLFTINYESMGYVNDEDAKDVDYDDLLKEIQEDAKNANPERVKQGFEPFEIIGWASHPFYDENKKVLHWAKEIKFGKSADNTLNYDLRILGRKGVFVLSAVAGVNQLPEVKANINSVISSIQFDKGNTYADFDSDTDEIAAWTVGGLVAGKVLAKVGFFAILLKFGKFILLGILALWAGLKKFVFGKKNHETKRPITAEIAEETEKPKEE